MSAISPGTDLATVLNASGSYTLRPGTHRVTASFAMAANVTLTAEEGATLVIEEDQILNFDDGTIIDGLRILMADNSRLQALAVSGNTFVDGARISNNTFMPTGVIAGTATAPLLRIGQGFGAGAYHRNIRVEGNIFYGTRIVQEVGDAMSYIGNQFYEMDGLRPIQLWGSNNRVERNFIDGGVFGISLLGRHDIAAFRRPCTGNLIARNIVLNTTEEGISLDIVANSAAQTVVREYDTVATTPGSSVITLASPNWSAQTTYTGSVYDLVFVSGTLAGKRYKITTHSGASFTLADVAADYASITVGDGVSIQLSSYGNTIANNIIIPKLEEGRDFSSGIVLHGTGTENTIVNNVTFGINNGAGTFYSNALAERNLNGIVATDAITYDGTDSGTIAATQRRAPVGLNIIANNRSLGGGYGVEYINYSSTPDFTPIGSAYIDMQDITRAGAQWIGGVNPTTAEGFKLRQNSPLIGSGVCKNTVDGAGRDYGGRRSRVPPDIGAWQRVIGD